MFVCLYLTFHMEYHCLSSFCKTARFIFVSFRHSHIHNFKLYTWKLDPKCHLQNLYLFSSLYQQSFVLSYLDQFYLRLQFLNPNLSIYLQMFLLWMGHVLELFIMSPNPKLMIRNYLIFRTLLLRGFLFTAFHVGRTNGYILPRSPDTF